MRGRFTDAHIELERAYAQIQGNGQENMALCCDFLARRLSLFTNVEQRCSLEERYAALLRHHDMAWINLWSATAAYYHALRGEVGNIPEIFVEHRLASVSILAPGKPMMEMIENQVYLAQGAYAKAAGRSGELLALCGELHYALVALQSGSRPRRPTPCWEKPRKPAHCLPRPSATPRRTASCCPSRKTTAI